MQNFPAIGVSGKMRLGAAIINEPIAIKKVALLMSKKRLETDAPKYLAYADLFCPVNGCNDSDKPE